MRETPDTRHLVDRRRLLAATSLGIAAAAFVPRSAGAASTADEEENRQTTRDFTKAMETGDWDRVSSLLAEDARFITHAARRGVGPAKRWRAERRSWRPWSRAALTTRI